MTAGDIMQYLPVVAYVMVGICIGFLILNVTS